MRDERGHHCEHPQGAAISSRLRLASAFFALLASLFDGTIGALVSLKINVGMAASENNNSNPEMMMIMAQ